MRKMDMQRRDWSKQTDERFPGTAIEGIENCFNTIHYEYELHNTHGG